MKLKINLAWKVVIGTPENGVDFDQATKHFNSKTGKTFVRKLGGVSSLNLYPSTFEPTNVFYNAVAPYKEKNDFFGKKLPFKGPISGSRKAIQIKIHQFFSDLIILSISVETVDFDGTIDELKAIMNFQSHGELLTLVKSIYSLICSGGQKTTPAQRKLKAYPYVELYNFDNTLIGEREAVELLTRHDNPKPSIVHQVISKNDDHQIDNNSILIDRQGILSRYFLENVEEQSIRRKFESSHYLFELAISLAHILEYKKYFSLKKEKRDAIKKLVTTPDIVFTKSVTSCKTWKLLLEEFKLVDLYNSCVETTQDDRPKWFLSKNWLIPIFSMILAPLIIWVITTPIYEELNEPPPLKLLNPPDEAVIEAAGKRVNFDWVTINTAKKYILVIEKSNSKTNGKTQLGNGGRYVLYKSSGVLKLNDYGRFKWKVFARDKDEKQISESVWFYFNVEKEKAIENERQSIPSQNDI